LTDFNQLGKPESLVQRERRTTVSGKATPGAVVSINGINAQVDAAGQFNASIPLREGKNRIVVVATDVSGREKKTALPKITVDSKAPSVKSKVRWGSKKKTRKKRETKRNPEIFVIRSQRTPQDKWMKENNHDRQSESG